VGAILLREAREMPLSYLGLPTTTSIIKQETINRAETETRLLGALVKWKERHGWWE
jgi:hypothetical protein